MRYILKGMKKVLWLTEKRWCLEELRGRNFKSCRHEVRFKQMVSNFFVIGPKISQTMQSSLVRVVRSLFEEDRMDKRG